MDDLQREIDRIEKHTRRYWFDDGIAEIAAGFVFLLVAAYLLVNGRLATLFEHGGVTGSKDSLLLNLLFAGLVVVLAFLAKRVTRAIKDRYVYPRTGFVAFERRERHSWARGALAAALGFLVSLLVLRTPIVQNWIPALLGGVLAAAFYYAGRRIDLLRFSLEGLLCAVAGIVVSLFHLDEDLAAGLLFAFLGLAVATGGAIALAGYVRRTRPPQEA